MVVGVLDLRLLLTLAKYTINFISDMAIVLLALDRVLQLPIECILKTQFQIQINFPLRFANRT